MQSRNSSFPIVWVIDLSGFLSSIAMIPPNELTLPCAGTQNEVRRYDTTPDSTFVFHQEVPLIRDYLITLCRTPYRCRQFTVISTRFGRSSNRTTVYSKNIQRSEYSNCFIESFIAGLVHMFGSITAHSCTAFHTCLSPTQTFYDT